VLKRFTFHVMWMSWIASRAMNTFWGVSMTVRGTGGLTADMLLLAVYQFDGMIWSASPPPADRAEPPSWAPVAAPSLAVLFPVHSRVLPVQGCEPDR